MMKALGVALVPTLAFVLHDFVFQLPDNQHEASAGFLLTIAGLLIVWAVSGYFAAAHAKRHLLRGALAGFVSVLALWLAFVVLNRLFVDRMSYEPDRIRAFQQSGAATMWDFVNGGFHPGPFPLLLAVAAVMGSVGGAIARRKETRLKIS